jgi:hypothetical protein
MMTGTPNIPTDPIAIIQQLHSATIRERIESLDRERQALMVLLRAAQRMERDKREKEGDDADR